MIRPCVKQYVGVHVRPVQQNENLSRAVDEYLVFGRQYRLDHFESRLLIAIGPGVQAINPAAVQSHEQDHGRGNLRHPADYNPALHLTEESSRHHESAESDEKVPREDSYERKVRNQIRTALKVDQTKYEVDQRRKQNRVAKRSVGVDQSLRFELSPKRARQKDEPARHADQYQLDVLSENSAGHLLKMCETARGSPVRFRSEHRVV